MPDGQRMPDVVLHSTQPQRVGFPEGNPRIIGAEWEGADHPVHHPNHYTHYKGLEVIDLTEQMNFNRGNAVKYICRAGIKDKAKEIEDLQKAVWYLEREIERIQK